MAHDVEELTDVAGELGKATASWALRYTELHPSQTGDYPEGRIAAEALGKVGGYLRHGSQVYAAVRDTVPTYATAVLLNHGGATSAAFREIGQIRDDLASAAVREGRAALEPNNERQQGIFKMATHLLRIKEAALARRGSARVIDNILSRDPFWAQQ